ncbi:MAG: hypothetical protein HQ538_04175 [Parcubacteria group bacterium]|nr:hypothetical protein [Parcubacteria group bacterium]
MKTLIIYYSRTGNNKKLAQELKGKINCDIEEIIDKEKRKGFFGFMKSGLQAISKKESNIEEGKLNPQDYDLTLIVTPFWVGSIPPMTRTYLKKNKDNFRKIALAGVSGNGRENNKAIQEFKSLTGKDDMYGLLIKEKDFKKGNYKDKLNNFVNKISR